MLSRLNLMLVLLERCNFNHMEIVQALVFHIKDICSILFHRIQGPVNIVEFIFLFFLQVLINWALMCIWMVTLPSELSWKLSTRLARVHFAATRRAAFLLRSWRQEWKTDISYKAPVLGFNAQKNCNVCLLLIYLLTGGSDCTTSQW